LIKNEMGFLGNSREGCREALILEELSSNAEGSLEAKIYAEGFVGGGNDPRCAITNKSQRPHPPKVFGGLASVMKITFRRCPNLSQKDIDYIKCTWQHLTPWWDVGGDKANSTSLWRKHAYKLKQ